MAFKIELWKSEAFCLAEAQWTDVDDDSEEKSAKVSPHDAKEKKTFGFAASDNLSTLTLPYPPLPSHISDPRTSNFPEKRKRYACNHVQWY